MTRLKRQRSNEVLEIESRLVDRIDEITTSNRRLALENAALSNIGRIISSSAGIDEVYERFCEQLRLLIPFDRMSISLYSQEQAAFTIEYASGIDVEGKPQGSTIPADISASGEVVRNRCGLTVQVGNSDDLTKWFPSLEPCVEAGLHSFLCVPMITKDQVVGVISLSAYLPGFYADEHLNLVERVSAPIAGAISIAQLYEERTLLQEQLNQAQKLEAIGRLAGGVAHDFNNLLTPILGYSQVGMRSLPPSNDMRGQFQKIYEASDRASQLVKQLLTFSRKEMIQPKSISLSKVIAGMNSILRRLIDENIQLITRPKADLRLAKMDKGQMEQVLVNLVVNARDAMPSGGRIIIEADDVDILDEDSTRHRTVPPGKYVRMSVSDNGIGMTNNVKIRIFEPFFTTKERDKGTGLGLAVCYGIIKQIGGYVFVDSEVGQGTTFTIYIPAVDGVEDNIDSNRSDKRPIKTGTETILFVEDDIAVREIAEYVLSEQGYTVIQASNGVEALQTLEEHEPNEIKLLFTDVVMPGLGGKELSDRAREIAPDIKVIYCSGYADDTVLKHGIPDTGTTFLQKPFLPEDLARKVREALDSD